MCTRRCLEVAGLFSVATITLVVAYADVGQPEPCIRVLEQDEPCPACPGFSSCICLYPGASCPGQNVSCGMRKQVEEGGVYPVLNQPMTCYISQGCASAGGGPCHPLNNPCHLVGMIRIVDGVQYQQDTTHYCGTG